MPELIAPSLARVARGEVDRQALDTLVRKEAGEKRAEIAQDAGKSATKLDNDAAKARKRIRMALTIAMPSFALAVVALIIVPDAIDARRPNQHPVAIRTEEPRVVRETGEQKATELRKEALEKCAKKDWDGCQTELEATYEMDPVGYLDPSVQNALLTI